MKAAYRFSIQPVLVNRVRQFQLCVGLLDDRDWECIPAHQTAFAQRVPLRSAHAQLQDAHLELSRLLTWMRDRRG